MSGAGPTIVFPCFIPRDTIAGGVRIIYRNVEMLNEAGYDAMVWCKDGHPTWFTSKAQVLTDINRKFPRGTHTILNEAVGLTDSWALYLFRDPGFRKQILVQGFYTVFLGAAIIKESKKQGVRHVIAVSNTVARFVTNTFPHLEAGIVPCSVDPALFKPARKRMQIAIMPRKNPQIANFIQQVFRAKYPRYAHIPWVAIDKMPQARVAELLGQSAIFVALGQNEGFGMPPVEAMTAGCMVVGLPSVGGRDYATEDNGYWYGSDDVIDSVDGLAAAVSDMEADNETYRRRIEGARLTALRYTPEVARAALLAHVKQTIG